jgi:hypothetical protein
MNIQCANSELIEVHKIVPNPKNPNKHPEEQIKRLSKIIDYQGQRSPIVISKRSGFVVKGHGRLEAIKLLGWEKCAVDYQDYKDEAQEYADIVADNAIAEWSNLSLADINFELGNLGPDFDIDNLGIKDFTIDISEKDLPDLESKNPDFRQMTFIVSNEQHDIISEAIKKAKLEPDINDEINKNQNGNAISLIAKRYVYS